MIFSSCKTAFSVALVAWMMASAEGASPFPTATPNSSSVIRDNLYDVAIQKKLAWIVGYYGTILHSRDRGLTWTKQPSGTTEALFRIVFRGESYGWACGSYGTLLHTQDSGETWQRQKIPLEEQLLGLDFTDERHGVAVGSRGAVLVTDNGGATWANHSIGDDVTLNDVRFIDNRRGWAVGEFGRIYYSQNGGKTWVKQKSPIEVDFASGESRSLFRLLLVNSNAAWAFGLDGTILIMQNGESWKVARQADASHAGVRKSHLFAAAGFGGNGWAVGERGTLVVSSLAKNEWRPVNFRGPSSTLNGIAFGDDHLGLIVGNRGLMLRSDDAGQHWRQTLFSLKTQHNGDSSSR